MDRRLRRTGLALVAIVFVLSAGVAPAIRYLDTRDRPAEAARLAAALGVRPGATVAEVGAGTGAMAVEMARLVGRDGEVIATELDPRQLAAIREAARRANVPNLSVLPAAEHSTNLPDACCDAIYMQRVYHHLTDPAGVIASARRALKPGGRLAVIDFEPGGIKNLWAPRGVPNRGGHGVPKDALVREMRSFGFVLRDDLAAWPDGEYLGVFVPATTGSKSKPRAVRELPALAVVLHPSSLSFR